MAVPALEPFKVKNSDIPINPMLKSHKNALFKVVQKAGLDPLAFDAEETNILINPQAQPASFARRLSRTFSFGRTSFSALAEEQPVFTIKLRDTPLKFVVTHASPDFNHYAYSYTAFKPKYPTYWSNKEVSLETLLRTFAEWLDNNVQPHFYEQQAPDLWLQIESYKSFVDVKTSKERDTAGFTEGEKTNVRRSLKEFKQLVEEKFNPSKEQREYIASELDYLAQAVDRLNHFDWRGLTIATLIGIAINLTLSKEEGQLLFQLLKQTWQSGIKLLE